MLSAVCLGSSCSFLFLLRALSLAAIVLATAMSFEPFPGVRLRGPPVPDDLSGLMHSCTGPNCTFCTWRRENPIELGWERLLEPEEACHRTTCIPHETGSAELLQANHLNNNENVPSLEVSPPISSHFQRIASTRTSAVVAYSDFTVNLYNYFLSKAGLFLTKLSLTTNL